MVNINKNSASFLCKFSQDFFKKTLDRLFEI
nr:MAG TPA: hypothetical protein [Caudoviricetes sp.]